MVNRIDGIFLRKALEIKQQLANGEVTSEMLDGFLDFVCEVYRRKFTIDDVYRGVEAGKLMNVVIKTIEGLMGNVTDKLDTFPANK